MMETLRRMKFVPRDPVAHRITRDQYAAGDYVLFKIRNNDVEWAEGIIEKVVSPVTVQVRTADAIHVVPAWHIRGRFVAG